MQSRKLASKNLCTGCMACVDTCAKGALTAFESSDGYYQMSFDEARCVDCGLCSDVCPIVNHKDFYCEQETAYAVWNETPEWRKASASGGAFSAVALAVLAKGGVVYGAATEGFVVKHKRVDTLDDLPQILGSKYQHSEMQGIYKTVLADLKSGRMVLVGGLSCQIVALKSYLDRFGAGKYCDNLYTIDTICGGLSTTLPMRLLQNTNMYRGIKSFRDKDNGWQSKGFRYSLKMQTSDGNVEDLKLDNLVLNTFSSKLLKRSSCLDCQFTGKHRASDATIGDFWGDEKFVDEHNDGVSVMIVHTKKISSLLEEAPLHNEKIQITSIVKGNHNYCWTHYPLVRCFMSRKFALWALKNGKPGLAQHCMRPKTLSGICMSIYLKLNNLLCARFERKNSYR